MTQDTPKPEVFLRTTYRDMRSPRFDSDHGFDSRYSQLQTWTNDLTLEVIEAALDRNHEFAPGTRMLISVHSNLDRAANYARKQRERLFFDQTYQDPDVWLHAISTSDLQWGTVQLRDDRYLPVLHGDDCVFFSTAAVREIFGAIKSPYATDDEWFAVGRIPARSVKKHFQLVDGLTMGDSRSPYKLCPVRWEALPDKCISLGDSLDAALSMAIQRRAEMSDREYDRMYHEAMQREEEHSSLWKGGQDDRVFTLMTRGSQQRVGVWM